MYDYLKIIFNVLIVLMTILPSCSIGQTTQLLEEKINLQKIKAKISAIDISDYTKANVLLNLFLHQSDVFGGGCKINYHPYGYYWYSFRYLKDGTTPTFEFFGSRDIASTANTYTWIANSENPSASYSQPTGGSAGGGDTESSARLSLAQKIKELVLNSTDTKWICGGNISNARFSNKLIGMDKFAPNIRYQFTNNNLTACYGDMSEKFNDSDTSCSSVNYFTKIPVESCRTLYNFARKGSAWSSGSSGAALDEAILSNAAKAEIIASGFSNFVTGRNLNFGASCGEYFLSEEIRDFLFSDVFVSPGANFATMDATKRKLAVSFVAAYKKASKTGGIPFCTSAKALAQKIELLIANYQRHYTTAQEAEGADFKNFEMPTLAKYETGKKNGCVIPSDYTLLTNAQAVTFFGITPTYPAPTDASISIESGAAYMTKTNPTVTLKAKGAAKYYLSQDASCSSNVAKDFLSPTATAAEKNQIKTINEAVTLTSTTDGTKNISVKFEDHVGNKTGCFQDSIILDKTVPSGSLSINDNATSTNSKTFVLTHVASDATSGLDVMLINNTQNCTGSGAWKTYSSVSTLVTTATTSGTQWVSIKFKDKAGNESGCISKSIYLDLNPSGTIAINNGDTATSNIVVTLNLTAKNNVNNTSGVQMYITNVGSCTNGICTCTTGGTWQSFANTKSCLHCR